MVQKIALFNHKGGVSKTTTAFNLGWILASKGKTVILADTDPRRSWCSKFFYRVGTLHATSLQLALVLIPKSMPTELSVLGNTSGKTSTTKLRKYRLAESLITLLQELRSQNSNIFFPWSPTKPSVKYYKFI